jgi:HAE1 family hydrophobic/amphiphilic exporter-1
MNEISGAIVAVTLVMTSVFVPVTFVPGPVGTFYRQFGITMAAAIVLSGIVALTLTPVLCAMILKPHTPGTAKRLGPVGLFLWLFDKGVNLVTAGYGAVLYRLVPRRLVAPLIVAGFAYGIVDVTKVLPTGFIPGEDQGMIYGIIQTPPGSTL